MTAYISGGPMSLLRGFSVRQAPILRQSVRIGLVVGMSLLSGCVSYSPMEIDPFEEIRKLEQRSDRPLEVQASAPGGPAWLPIKTTIDLSDGLELSEANALALSFSPGIRATRNEIEGCRSAAHPGRAPHQPRAPFPLGTRLGVVGSAWRTSLSLPPNRPWPFRGHGR